MILPPVYELSIVGVADVGIANSERIILRPTESINLAQFGLTLGLKGENELVTPLRDNFFWFGELVTEPPSWLIVYTGPGQFEITHLQGSGQIAYSFHWGKQYTVFNQMNIVPVIFRLGGILTGIQLPKSNNRQLTT